MASMIIACIGYLIGFLKLHNDQQVKNREIQSDLQAKLREIDVRLGNVEKQDDEIYAKLDKIMDKLIKIEIGMQNKVDR